MLGPALIAHGSAEQQHRYLGPMLRGDEVWCQLFSEPGAGSDLAAVQCRARSDADGGWLVNGQKVWTTNAQFASFGMLLGRTDPAVPKHRGLTMFIVPMDAAGVTVRPLRQISGEAHFNEVFLDDVRLGADAVVDAVGGGWRVALTVLMFERLAVGNQAEDFGVNAEALAAAIAGAHRDADVRARLGEVASELLALRFGSYRTMTELQAGRTPGPEAGLGKITLVRAAAEAAELACDVLGPAALVPGSPWSQMTSMVPGLKSAGGTEQILRSTIGERVLGLPPEPRLDKDVPFAELTRAR
jgi:alkylation response protein AidB-like acyl-CoA dehydrogenase